VVEYIPMIKKETIVGTPKIYEVGALFVPELDAPVLSQAIDSLKKKISDLEGNIISAGEPVYIKTAYTVEKHINNKIRKAEFAHFTWIKFEMSPENLKDFDKFLSLNMGEQVLRYTLHKAIRANTQLTEMVGVKGSMKEDKLIDEVLESKGEEADAASTQIDSPIEKVEEVVPVVEVVEEVATN
jgi:ribosomal protein S6